jgi:hypothetical protein
MRCGLRILVFVMIPVFAWASFSQIATTPEKKSISLKDIPHTVMVDLFQPGFDQGDSNYNALTSVSDDTLHFVVNSHNSKYGCRYYIFDPRSDSMKLAGKLDQVLGEPAETHIPQGKVHTPLIEHKGKLWFATHTSFYHGDLPELDSGARIPYSGGRFMSYDLKTGQFDDLAKVLPGEGIITMAMDTVHEVLCGLTWPSGILVSYEIGPKALHCWGAVQGRGEWGNHPQEWDRICRTLGVDPSGKVYGSTMDGKIWKYDASSERRVSFIEGLDLSRLPLSQSSEETDKGDFQYNWRSIAWNPTTQSFWGILWETTTLFEFVPTANYLRSMTEMRPEAYRGMPRNPEISQLGFMLGPNNTLYYLAHGPAVDIEGRPPVQSGLYLLTYDIGKDRLVNHGPIFSHDQRRVFFAESIAIGIDDHIYTVAWVEVTDPSRRNEISVARQSGPAETSQMIYEMLLVRLPKWQELTALSLGNP